MSEETRSQKFWKVVGKIRSFLSNFLFLVILLAISAAIVGSFFGSGLKDPEGKALVINPPGPIVEQIEGGNNPVASLLQGQPQKQLLVNNLLEVLENVKTDDRIKFIVLNLDNIYGTGQTVLFDVGQALKELRQAGKIIISTGDNYDQSGYYLASFSDEIIINPDGFIFLEGLSRYRTYFKSLL